MDYQHDDLIEEIGGGTVLSVQSPADGVNSISSKNFALYGAGCLNSTDALRQILSYGVGQHWVVCKFLSRDILH